MKNVFLLPGIFASDLGVQSTGEILWWNPNVVGLIGLSKMGLAADGITPLEPDGVQLAVSTDPQAPWNSIVAELVEQLDVAEWNVAVAPYDWRLDPSHHALVLKNRILATSTPAQPATLVGHSLGGLIALLAYQLLQASGQAAYVRRIVTICSPLQGSYASPLSIAGLNPSVQQLLALGQATQWNPLANVSALTLAFINATMWTWPAMYALFPSFVVSPLEPDPNRALLYTASNYPSPIPVKQPWLDWSKNAFQPLLQQPAIIPPSWVYRCVYGYGLDTPSVLGSSAVPIDLASVAVHSSGDSIVSTISALPTGSPTFGVNGTHSSIQLAIARSGLLAELITDPQGPPDPPPPSVVFKTPIAQNVTDPPQSDAVTGLVCLGGHC